MYRAHRNERCEDQIALWMLRVLLRVGDEREVRERLADMNRLTLRALGLATPLTKTPPPARLAVLLGDRLATLEREPPPASRALRNAALMGRLLGLTDADVAILALVIAAQGTPALSAMLAAAATPTFADICRLFAAALALPVPTVRRALVRDGALRSIPILRRDPSEAIVFSLGHAVESVLGDLLDGEADLVRHYVTPAPRPTRTREDFPHLARECDLVARLLRAAHARHARGVNVLVYGPPGTGKTEFARLVAAEANAALLETRLEDEDQDAREGRQRLEAYALCQRMLRGHERAVLLLDEAEDVFPAGTSWFGVDVRHPDRRKAWTNRLLEESPVPTIWISNSITGIDPAHVRRFDCAVEIGPPPRSVRRRVLDRHLRGAGITPEHRARLAEVEALSPGHVQRAGRVLRLLGVGRDEAGPTLDHLLDGNLRAYAGKRPPRHRGLGEAPYDRSLLNTSSDVERILEGLRRNGTGTLCFYGPPGTGKTAFARHIAAQIDRPLVAKRASDLLSMWVGGSEKNIARMFEEAEREGAVLLLDEADSMLQDRRGAHRSWEVTQVNEMLTQMERFEGVFICSTNLLAHLDAASLRRFAIKVKFDYMTEAQAERMFLATLRVLADGASDAGASGTPGVTSAPGASGAPDEGAAGLGASGARVSRPGTPGRCAGDHAAVLRQLARLKTLTPGDFVAVTRQYRVTGEAPTAAALLCAIEYECSLKRDGAPRAVGFDR
jgi:adenylate kinase family enzyme